MKKKSMPGTMDYLGADIPFSDLFDIGVMGLIKAIEKFDESKGSFSNYAVININQCITRYIENESRTLRIPVHLNNVLNNIERIKENYYKANGTYPTDEFLINEYNKFNFKYKLNMNAFLKLKIYSKQFSSLNSFAVGEKNQDPDTELIEFIASEDDLPIDEIIVNEHKSMILRNILDGTVNTNLNEKERMVLWYRYGFDDGIPKTLVEIGNMLNLTRERIRQIENKGLTKLSKSRIFKEYFSNEEKLLKR